MFEDHGEDTAIIFETGKVFIEPILDKRMDIVGGAGWTEQKLELFDGEFWTDLQRRIKERSSSEETPETLEQLAAREAGDMMILGRLDKDPDSKIDPKAYKSKENAAYIQRAMNVYAALRLQRPSLSQDEAIAFARQFAEKLPAARPPSNHRKSTP